MPEENCGGLAVECLPSQEYLEAERNKGKIATDVLVNEVQDHSAINMQVSNLQLESSVNVSVNVGANVVYFRITNADIQSCRIINPTQPQKFHILAV
ncbi:MAG: hypothetical protein J5709_08555 [Bacteroidales bacterium]|nr:hypothetical protein [Bacteroidales bacterium]